MKELSQYTSENKNYFKKVYNIHIEFDIITNNKVI